MKVYYTEDSFIDIPFSLDEIDFEQFIDFKKQDNLYRKASTIETPHDEELDECDSTDEETINIVKADIAKWIEKNVTEEDHENIYAKSVNQLYETLLVFYTEEALTDLPVREKEAIEPGFTYNLDNLFNSKLTWVLLYSHIVNLIDQYEPKELKKKFSIEWKNKTYVINAQKALDLLIDTSFTGGEVLTLLEFRRHRLNEIKKTGDLDGNIEFKLGIHEMAILLREEGTQLPMNRAALVNYIDKQGDVFRRLPLSVVLSVRFFLIFIIKEYLITKITDISLTHLKGKGEAKNKEKLTQMPKIKIKLYGKLLDGSQYMKSLLKGDGSKETEKLIMNQYS